jgi:hypothetical protein
MKTKNSLPGFTADASIYPTERAYAAATTIGRDFSTMVVPQFPVGLCTKAAYYCNRGYQKWCDILDRVCFPDV